MKSFFFFKITCYYLFVHSTPNRYPMMTTQSHNQIGSQQQMQTAPLPYCPNPQANLPMPNQPQPSQPYPNQGVAHSTQMPLL